MPVGQRRHLSPRRRRRFQRRCDGIDQPQRSENPPHADADINLTSAALETLKFICFDLAALISGVEGRTRHPLFLLHDGPREANMDTDLDQQISRTIHSLEGTFGTNPINFQYIVTITEPHPTNSKKTT